MAHAILQSAALLAWLAGAAFIPSLSTAWAETEYPARPVQIVVPFVPGGNTDLITRIIADGLALALKQPFTVCRRAPEDRDGDVSWDSSVLAGIRRVGKGVLSRRAHAD